MAKVLGKFISEIFEREHFVENYKRSSSLRGKIHLQILVACAFLLFSVANIFTKSYFMLAFTAVGCVINLLFSALAYHYKKVMLCAVSAIVTCSALFGFFVIYGGNDGFACLWVVLLPLMSMVAMSFMVGFLASVFFQIFLMVVFWTPLRGMLFYRYSDQFCLRFPLFFFITFLLGLLITVTLRKSEYNECKNLLELEELSNTAREMARTDPLTKLANRRFAYEQFETNYTAKGVPHCVVMGDVDSFKVVNDTYGHEFGDSVLIAYAEMMDKLLPPDYLKARWGGEEFLFAANAPIDEVYAEVEKLRQAIAGHIFVCNDISVTITITFGIAEYADKEELFKAISTADNRLYRGKTGHKNCTVASD